MFLTKIHNPLYLTMHPRETALFPVKYQRMPLYYKQRCEPGAPEYFLKTANLIRYQPKFRENDQTLPSAISRRISVSSCGNTAWREYTNRIELRRICQRSEISKIRHIKGRGFSQRCFFLL